MRIYGLWEELSKIIFRSNTRKVTVEPASQTTGDSTITIPDMAGTTQQAILSSQSQTLTNKTIDSDLNTITNIVDADIKSTAAIARSKVAAGTVNHVLINDGSGNFSSEATLATTRGGTGQNSSATFPTSGVLLTRSSVDQAGNRLTNKDLDDATTQVVDTADTSKALKFDVTGTASTSTTLTTSQTANRVLTLPDATDTLVAKNTTDTLTNKTLGSSNAISGATATNFTNSGTVTLPSGTRTLVARDTTDTLTNKSIDSDTNTLSNIKDSDIKAAAAIARTKLASGTLNHVIINDGSGVLSSEAQLAATRGGTGVNSSATFPTSGTILTRTSADQGSGRLANKDLEDATTQIVDSVDTTKAIKFDAAGTTGTATTLTSSQTANRVLTLPNATDTLVGKATTDTLTNKSIDSDTNTLSNIKDADIKAGAAIARTKLASGTANHVLINDGTGVASSEASLAISRGGTGQATAVTGFNALSPNTTKGDLVGFDGTNNVRFPVGADGQVLAADSAAASGLSWSSPLVNPMDSPGDLIVGSTGGAAARLDHPGVAGQVLATTGASVTAWTAGPSLTTVTTSGLGTLGSARVSNLSTGVVHSNGTGDLSSSLVVNADVSASAAIAYSKLSLSGSIVNADVNASAAIAGSKISPNFGHQDVTGDRIISSGSARNTTRHSWTFPSGNASYVLGGDALGTNTFDLYNVTANRYLLSYTEGSQQLTLGDSNQTGSTILAGGNISTVAPTYIGDASNTASLNLTAPSTGGAQFNITRSGNNTIRMGHQISTSNTFDIYDITNSKAIITYGTSTQNLTISNGITGSTTIKGPGGLAISFPATDVASADANTLDDYEEGTWSANWTGSTSGSLGVSTSRVCKYVKIGKTVYFKVYMQGITGTIANLVGAVGFDLPFTSDSQADNNYAVTIGYFNNFATNNVWYGGYITSGSNKVFMAKMNAAASAISSLISSDLSSTSTWVVSGWYLV